MPEEADAPPSTIWVEPGTVIWDRPGAHAQAVVRVQTVAELPVTEVASGWVRVVYLDRSGWVVSPEVDSGDALAHSPCQQIDLEDPSVRCLALGWVWLITDLSEEESSEVESRLASLPARYQARYGDFDNPSGSPSWFAVLRGRGAFEAFLEQVRRRLAVDATAVASGRVAAMVVREDRSQTEAVLVHEAIHLLNRVALGEGLPPWLEEGTAGCFGLLDDDGVVVGATRFNPILVYHQAGWSEQQTEVSHAGPRGAVARLRTEAAAGELRLDPMLTAGRQAFYRPAEREHNYELASFLTCYLAARVFRPEPSGLVGAWSSGSVDGAVADEWLPASLAAWADELLHAHESVTGSDAAGQE